MAEAALWMTVSVILCSPRKTYEREKMRMKGGRGEDLQHEVGVHEIVETLQEDRQQAETGEQTGERGHDPMGRGLVSRPAEPEQAAGEGDTAEDDGEETPFRNGDAAVGFELAVVRRLGEGDVDTRRDLAEDHAEIGQTAHAGVEVVDLLEDDGIGGEEEVEQAIDEGHVDAQEQNDGFGHEEPQRTAEILGHEFAEIDFDFFLFGVDAPVESSAAEHGCFLFEHDGRVGFLEEDEVETKGQKSHDADEIFRPSPA